MMIVTKATRAGCLSILIVLLSMGMTKSQGVSCSENYLSAACDRPIVLMLETDYQTLIVNANQIPLMDINITTVLSGISQNLLVANSVEITNSSYFEDLGTVSFNLKDGGVMTAKVFHGFKMKSLNYPLPVGSEIIISVSYSSNLSSGGTLPNLYVQSFASRVKKCGNCTPCFSRYELIGAYNLLFNSSIGVFAMHFDLGQGSFSQLNVGNSSPTIDNQISVVALMNWLTGLTSPTVADYFNILDTGNLPLTTAPSNVCVYDNSQSCQCLKDILDFYLKVIEVIKGTSPTSLDGSYYSMIEQHLLTYCDCSGAYCFEANHEVNSTTSNLESVRIRLLPKNKFNLPALYIYVVLDGPDKFSTLAYSYDFGSVQSGSNTGIIQADIIPLNSVTYGSSGFVYTTSNGFQSYTGLLSQLDECIPCEKCLQSFSPQPGKQYYLTTWVSEFQPSLSKTTFDRPSVEIKFEDMNSSIVSTSGPIYANGPIIDGWQKIDYIFTVPANVFRMRLELQAEDGDCYFDDIRITPKESSSNTFVFDPVTLRLSAVLDERNYATFYEYDTEGSLTRIKQETERGIMTVKEIKASTIKN